MLTDLEKDRLIKRNLENSHTRSTNDIRVRKKLQAWLNEVPDIMLILNNLPSDQLDKIISDDDVIAFLQLGFVTQIKKNFCPVFGELDKPEDWNVLDWDILYKVERSGDKNLALASRPAEERDIIRAVRLIDVIKDLVGDSSNLDLRVNLANPVDVAMHLEKIYSNPDLRDRLTKGEIMGIEKIMQILEKHRPKKWRFAHESPDNHQRIPVQISTNLLKSRG